MAEQSDLEKIGIITRDTLKAKNTFNDGDGKKYQGGHTRAMQDDTTPVHGKGTGNEGPTGPDVFNGGGSLDIYGTPEVPGSGRVKSLASNEFNKDKEYTKPDTSENKGQVIID